MATEPIFKVTLRIVRPHPMGEDADKEVIYVRASGKTSAAAKALRGRENREVVSVTPILSGDKRA